VRDHPHKLAPLLFALCTLATAAGAQEREYAAAPNLKLTLSVAKNAWRPGEPAAVRMKVENATGERFEIPSTISFKADNRANDGVRVTMSHGVFWSPVSLNKTYGGRPSGCQDDLAPGRVETVSGKVRIIHPARDKIVLEKGEAKEFSFDLAGTCWGHSLGSYYPSLNLFEVAERYTNNSYRVYFQMQFPMRLADPVAPRYHQLKSNAVEVTID
jgi:hypothetical protein